MPTLARRAVSHEPRELLEVLSGSGLRAAHPAQAECVMTCTLELGILERPALVQRPPMAVVAGVEAMLGHKLRKSQALTRHLEQSRTESADLLPCRET
jgi:hypothetical protein